MVWRYADQPGLFAGWAPTRPALGGPSYDDYDFFISLYFGGVMLGIHETKEYPPATVPNEAWFVVAIVTFVGSWM